MFRSNLTLFRALKALLFYQLQPKMGRFDSVLHFQKKKSFKMASAIRRRSHLEHATNYALSELYCIRMLTLDMRHPAHPFCNLLTLDTQPINKNKQIKKQRFSSEILKKIC